MVDRTERAPGPGGAAGAEPSRWEPVAGGSARDGLVGVYAERVVDRGVDLRSILSELRPPSYAVLDRAAAPARARRGDTVAVRSVGRGTAGHRAAVRGARRGTPRRRSAPRLADAFAPVVRWLSGSDRGRTSRPNRRLVATGLALAILLGGGLGVAAAEPPAQQRYLAQPGDSLDGVAALFGVDPTAIAAASGLTDGTPLQPAQIVVIPAPGQAPDDAARMAAGLEGTSPFAVGAHLVAPGETLAGIADRHGVTPQAIADLNGLAHPDVLGVGQRLLIPPPEGVGGPSPPAAGAAAAVFVPGVPAYVQQRNLSCEYAAAYIATGTFGAGVPEAVFVESVPPARNPHWGYRGNIDGWWGNTDDYGVYAEALVPVLNAGGYEAEVFYSGGDPDALRARLDAGRPVLTWLGYWGDTGVTFEDEGTYTVAAGMHVVVAYGYDDWGVHVSNPADGEYEYYSWADFGAMWSVLDGMGLAVAPAA